jgi:hypothetical protein
MGHFTSINIVSVLVAALTGFVIGGLWYGPLFRTLWMKHSGMTFERGKQQNPVVVFGLTYVLNVIAAASLAALLGHNHTWLLGAHTGLFTGVGLVSTTLGINYLFESRPWQLWLINAGYQVVNFTAMGTVVGLWQ